MTFGYETDIFRGVTTIPITIIRVILAATEFD